MRTAIGAALILAGSVILAAVIIADSDQGRYSVSVVDDGVVRVDSRTGEVIACDMLSCRVTAPPGPATKPARSFPLAMPGESASGSRRAPQQIGKFD